MYNTYAEALAESKESDMEESDDLLEALQNAKAKDKHGHTHPHTPHAPQHGTPRRPSTAHVVPTPSTVRRPSHSAHSHGPSPVSPTPSSVHNPDFSRTTPPSTAAASRRQSVVAHTPARRASNASALSAHAHNAAVTALISPNHKGGRLPPSTPHPPYAPHSHARTHSHSANNANTPALHSIHPHSHTAHSHGHGHAPSHQMSEAQLAEYEKQREARAQAMNAAMLQALGAQHERTQNELQLVMNRKKQINMDYKMYTASLQDTMSRISNGIKDVNEGFEDRITEYDTLLANRSQLVRQLKFNMNARAQFNNNEDSVDSVLDAVYSWAVSRSRKAQNDDLALKQREKDQMLEITEVGDSQSAINSIFSTIRLPEPTRIKLMNRLKRVTQKELDGEEKSMQELAKRIVQLRTGVNEEKKQKDALQENLNAMTQEMELAKSRISYLEDSLSEKLKVTNQQKGRWSLATVERVEQLEKEIRKQRKLVIEVDKKRFKSAQQVTQLNKRIVEKDSEISALSKTIQGLQAEVEKLHAFEKHMNMNLTDRESHTKHLSGQLAGYRTECALLKSLVEDLLGERENIIETEYDRDKLAQIYKLKNLFTLLDRNSDGMIESDDIVYMLHRIGFPINLEAIDHMHSTIASITPDTGLVPVLLDLLVPDRNNTQAFAGMDEKERRIYEEMLASKLERTIQYVEKQPGATLSRYVTFVLKYNEQERDAEKLRLLKRLEYVFRGLDSNKDGILQYGELENAYKKENISVSKKDLDSVYVALSVRTSEHDSQLKPVTFFEFARYFDRYILKQIFDNKETDLDQSNLQSEEQAKETARMLRKQQKRAAREQAAKKKAALAAKRAKLIAKAAGQMNNKKNGGSNKSSGRGSSKRNKSAEGEEKEQTEIKLEISSDSESEGEGDGVVDGVDKPKRSSAPFFPRGTKHVLLHLLSIDGADSEHAGFAYEDQLREQDQNDRPEVIMFEKVIQILCSPPAFMPQPDTPLPKRTPKKKSQPKLQTKLEQNDGQPQPSPSEAKSIEGKGDEDGEEGGSGKVGGDAASADGASPVLGEVRASPVLSAEAIEAEHKHQLQIAAESIVKVTPLLFNAPHVERDSPGIADGSTTVTPSSARKRSGPGARTNRRQQSAEQESMEFDSQRPVEQQDETVESADEENNHGVEQAEPSTETVGEGEGDGDGEKELEHTQTGAQAQNEMISESEEVEAQTKVSPDDNESNLTPTDALVNAQDNSAVQSESSHAPTPKKPHPPTAASPSPRAAARLGLTPIVVPQPKTPRAKPATGALTHPLPAPSTTGIESQSMSGSYTSVGEAVSVVNPDDYDAFNSSNIANTTATTIHSTSPPQSVSFHSSPFVATAPSSRSYSRTLLTAATPMHQQHPSSSVSSLLSPLPSTPPSSVALIPVPTPVSVKPLKPLSISFGSPPQQKLVPTPDSPSASTSAAGTSTASGVPKRVGTLAPARSILKHQPNDTGPPLQLLASAIASPAVAAAVLSPPQTTPRIFTPTPAQVEARLSQLVTDSYPTVSHKPFPSTHTAVSSAIDQAAGNGADMDVLFGDYNAISGSEVNVVDGIDYYGDVSDPTSQASMDQYIATRQQMANHVRSSVEAEAGPLPIHVHVPLTNTPAGYAGSRLITPSVPSSSPHPPSRPHSRSSRAHSPHTDRISVPLFAPRYSASQSHSTTDTPHAPLTPSHDLRTPHSLTISRTHTQTHTYTDTVTFTKEDQVALPQLVSELEYKEAEAASYRRLYEGERLKSIQLAEQVRTLKYELTHSSRYAVTHSTIGVKGQQIEPIVSNEPLAQAKFQIGAALHGQLQQYIDAATRALTEARNVSPTRYTGMSPFLSSPMRPSTADARHTPYAALSSSPLPTTSSSPSSSVNPSARRPGTAGIAGKQQSSFGERASNDEGEKQQESATVSSEASVPILKKKPTRNISSAAPRSSRVSSTSVGNAPVTARTHSTSGRNVSIDEKPRPVVHTSVHAKVSTHRVVRKGKGKRKKRSKGQKSGREESKEEEEVEHLESSDDEQVEVTGVGEGEDELDSSDEKEKQKVKDTDTVVAESTPADSMQTNVLDSISALTS